MFQAKIDRGILDRTDAIADTLKELDPDLEFIKTHVVKNALRNAILTSDSGIIKMKGELKQ